MTAPYPRSHKIYILFIEVIFGYCLYILSFYDLSIWEDKKIFIAKMKFRYDLLACPFVDPPTKENKKNQNNTNKQTNKQKTNKQKQKLNRYNLSIAVWINCHQGRLDSQALQVLVRTCLVWGVLIFPQQYSLAF